MSYLVDYYKGIYILDKEVFRSSVEKLPNDSLRNELIEVVDSDKSEYPNIDTFLEPGDDQSQFKCAVLQMVEHVDFSYVKDRHKRYGSFKFPNHESIPEKLRDYTTGCPTGIFSHKSIAWLMSNDPTMKFYDGEYARVKGDDDDNDDDDEPIAPEWRDDGECQEYGRAGCKQCWMNCWKALEPFFKTNTTK